MEQCPQCGQAVDKELFCRTCGHPLVDGGQPVPADKRPRAKTTHLIVVLMAFVVVGVGSLMLVASDRRRPSATAEATASPAIQSTTHTPTDANTDAAPARRAAEWIVREPNLRTRQAGAGVAFELAADAEVDVWRKRVRPVLTVRCAGQATEVFVVTHSPASIEDNTRLHRVTVAFDGGPTAPARWEHSVDHDALFAPDGDEMARQIASATTMTLTFTPFNAPDTSIHFGVAGLATHLDTGAKRCARKK